MQTLPVELILVIAKQLTAASCLNLAHASPKYAWLLTDASLWKYLAARDLAYPEAFFERQLRSMTPARLYEHLSICQHSDKIDGTFFIERCNQPIFPGTPYCKNHCWHNCIRICCCCESRPIIPTSRPERVNMCPTCLKTQAWKKECQWMYMGIQCGYKRLPNKLYCSYCGQRPDIGSKFDRPDEHNVTLTDPDPDPDPIPNPMTSQTTHSEYNHLTLTSPCQG